MWKSLLCSSKTSIRTAYCNHLFPGELPVIVCTNDFNLFNLLSTDDLFKGQTYCLELTGD